MKEHLVKNIILYSVVAFVTIKAAIWSLALALRLTGESRRYRQHKEDIENGFKDENSPW